MSENCKCGGNCESTREEFNVKSIEKAYDEKRNAVIAYNVAMRKLAEIGVNDESVTALAQAKKRAESEIIRLKAVLAEAKLAAKNKSEVSLEQKRKDAIQKIKDGSFDFLASYDLVRAEERAELDKAIDDGIKEIIGMVTFAGGLGIDLSKVMSEATKERKEKSKAGSQKIDRELAELNRGFNQELAGLNSLLDELMKSGLQ